MSAAVAAAVAGWLRPQPTAATPALATVGAACGIALFALIARRLRPPPLTRLSAGVAAVLVLGALAEEIVWRLGALTALAWVLPASAALALATGAFALAHGATQGRRGVATHLVSGASFGTLFLATGSLASAAAAHAVYNLLAAASAGRSMRPSPAPAAIGPPPACLLDAVKRFGTTTALDEVDLEVRAGEVLCLLGPNGAGKTTACGLLLGLRRPTAGRAELFGLDPRTPAARRRVGATPQESGFPPSLRVAEIAALVARHFERPEAVGPLLERFRLGELARRQSGGLSGGQRRLLSVALAFVGRPELALLDEPTTALDLDARRFVRDEIRALARGGAAVLLTTHDLAEAEELADRVVVLVRGRVAAEGTVARIRSLVGLSTIVVPAQRLPPLPGLVAAERRNGSLVLTVRDAGDAIRALAFADGQLAGLEVRPASLEDAVATVMGSA